MLPSLAKACSIKSRPNNIVSAILDQRNRLLAHVSVNVRFLHYALREYDIMYTLSLKIFPSPVLFHSNELL